MADIENGGFAFPGPVCGNGSEHQITDSQWQAHGMTLRDYFAAKAMHAICTRLAEGVRPNDCVRMAEDAYFIADAMLKARKEPQ